MVEEEEKEPQNFLLLEEISKRGRMGLGGLGKLNKGLEEIDDVGKSEDEAFRLMGKKPKQEMDEGEATEKRGS